MHSGMNYSFKGSVEGREVGIVRFCKVLLFKRTIVKNMA